MIYYILLSPPVLAAALVLRFFVVRLIIKLSTKSQTQVDVSKLLPIIENSVANNKSIHTDRINPFLNELNNIDFQYLLFFLFREPATPEDVRDRLSNHYKFEVECGKAYFAFLPTSDLPAAIRRKCNEKFRNYFENGILL